MSPLEFEKIDVGGTVRLAGKSKGGVIDVGGSFRAEGDLEFEEIEVGGTVDIAGLTQGGHMEVGGKIDIRGSLKLSERLEVGGTANVSDEIAASRHRDRWKSARTQNCSRRTRGSRRFNHTDEGVSARIVEIGRRGEVHGSHEGRQDHYRRQGCPRRKCLRKGNPSANWRKRE